MKRPAAARLREAAALVISPAGHADDTRVQTAFRLLRDHAPVYRVDIPGIRPFWAITRYADLVAIERPGAPFSAAPRTVLSSEIGEAGLRQISGKREIVRGLTHMDPPDHAAYRALAQPWFSPAGLAELQPWLAAWADSIVARVAGRDQAFDFAADVAAPFTLRVFMRILGLPEADDALILKLSRGLIGAEDPARRLANYPTEAVRLAAVGLRDYFEPVVADRQARPRNDLASVIANACVHGAPIPEYEQLSYYMLMATAGHDTTAFCISGGLHALVTHPAEFTRLQNNPALLDGAIEEMLRWASPVRHFMRTATADTEVGGQPVRDGDSLALFFGSANRDSAVFDDPDTFRIDRRPNPHVAFGLGPHFCLGAHLARMEMRSVFRALLPRLQAVELVGPPQRTQSAFITGIASLPVRCAWCPRPTRLS